MQSFIHADIFFVVTTIAVVILTIGSGVVIYLMIKTLRDVRRIIKRINRFFK